MRRVHASAQQPSRPVVVAACRSAVGMQSCCGHAELLWACSMHVTEADNLPPFNLRRVAGIYADVTSDKLRAPATAEELAMVPPDPKSRVSFATPDALMCCAEHVKSLVRTCHSHAECCLWCGRRSRSALPTRPLERVTVKPVFSLVLHSIMCAGRWPPAFRGGGCVSELRLPAVGVRVCCLAAGTCGRRAPLQRRHRRSLGADTRGAEVLRGHATHPRLAATGQAPHAGMLRAHPPCSLPPQHGRLLPQVQLSMQCPLPRLDERDVEHS